MFPTHLTFQQLEEVYYWKSEGYRLSNYARGETSKAEHKGMRRDLNV